MSDGYVVLEIEKQFFRRISSQKQSFDLLLYVSLYGSSEFFPD